MSNKSEYKSVAEWRKKDSNAYATAKARGLLDYICEYFGWDKVKKYIPPGYWTKEKCLSEALKYKSKTEWNKHSHGSQKIAYNNGWIEECCVHMEVVNVPKGYWTKERCIEDARKYKTKTEWNKNSGAYQKSSIEGWLDECCAHMKITRKPNGYWTKEKCIEDARKYTGIKQWAKAPGGGSSSAEKYGWFEECIAHMERKVKPSGYWTKEKCIEEALKYKTKEEWKKNSSSSNTKARERGWYEEASAHMVMTRKPPGFWKIKENVIEESKKYDNLHDWVHKADAACRQSRKNGWFEECVAHMKMTRRPKNHWKIKKNVLEEAKNHKTMGKWMSSNCTSYNNAKKYGWFEECVAHMNIIRVPTGYWEVKENVLEEAVKHKTRSNWAKASPSSYTSSKKFGWFEECVAHMDEVHKPKGYWTKEKCIEEALKYKTKEGWKKNSEFSQKHSRKNGWFEECCKHMNND